MYRGDKPSLNVEGKVVILVDDGIATGSSAKAAVVALRKRYLTSLTSLARSFSRLLPTARPITRS
jgi:predicted phosphoribosyltransferase